ncbi:MAG TPA: gamma-glutamyltransferase [Acidobacteriaceae bacterium]|nr:gamma-glutamyltransferase [Acidobacteriaceae bacterium]
MNRTIREGLEITCENGAVATGPAEAAQAGAAILAEEGNAFDAAAAACLACAVMQPQQIDLGGYVLAAVLREGATGRIWSVDANTTAPAAAAADMFRTHPVRSNPTTYLDINEREYGCTVEGDANIYGPLAVSVPGFIAGVGALSERWGQLPWPQIIAPARALVAAGIPYSRILSDVLFKREAIARYPSTLKFLLPDGFDHLPNSDALWLRADLLRTLDRLATAGWRDFYTGELAHTIADFVVSQGGLLSREDMAAFEPRITDPLTGSYRNAQIHTAIAPNGGFSVLSALADLEQQPMFPDTDPRYWDTMAKVLTRMWTERLANSPLPGTSPHGTMHIAASDRSGNIASVTVSQGGLFGSCLAVPGTGIMLAHGMCRFEPRPNHANSPGPSKRPLNNVCPLLIHLPDRDVAIGVRGGRRIVSVSVQLAQRIVDNEVTAYQAATAPRIHTLSGNPLEISADFDPAIREALDRSGYKTEIPDEVGGSAHAAEFFSATRTIRAGGNVWAAGV